MEEVEGFFFGVPAPPRSPCRRRSECFDTLEDVRIIEIVPQADCDHCGRICLGYLTARSDAAAEDDDGPVDDAA